jgi:hypothetical protein
VSDHGLDDRAIEVRSPVDEKEMFSNLCVHTGCGVLPASCPMGTGGKARPGVTLTTHRPFIAEIGNEQELYLLSFLRLHRRVVGLLCSNKIILERHVADITK